MTEEDIEKLLSRAIMEGAVTEKNVIPYLSKAAKKLVDPTLAITVFKRISR